MAQLNLKIQSFYVLKVINNLINYQFYTINNIIFTDKLGALWPFLGIVAEVIILCTIIFMYERRRVKPDFDESDADHNLER